MNEIILQIEEDSIEDIKKYHRALFWLEFFVLVIFMLIIFTCFFFIIQRMNAIDTLYQQHIEQKLYTEKEAKTEKKVEQFMYTATTYNPMESQTDSSPCRSSIGVDICERAKNGENIIALSQDLILGSRGAYCRENCPFAYGEVVIVRSDNKNCNIGRAIILDTMHERHKNMVDIFLLDPNKNTKCIVEIEKI